jgi:hypothetical protein
MKQSSVSEKGRLVVRDKKVETATKNLLTKEEREYDWPTRNIAHCRR